jgi:hypothetical protein
MFLLCHKGTRQSGQTLDGEDRQQFFKGDK